MNGARVGGWLTLSASGLFLLAGAVAATGGAVSAGGDGFGGRVVTAALLLLAGGAGVLAAAAPPGLSRLSTRIGLALVAGGLAVTLATSNVSPSSMLVFVFLAGGAVSLLGLVVTALSLASSSGVARLIAMTFLAGVVLAIGAGIAANAAVGPDGPLSSVLQLVAGALATLGGVAMVGALAGVGVVCARAPGRTHRLAR